MDLGLNLYSEVILLVSIPENDNPILGHPKVSAGERGVIVDYYNVLDYGKNLLVVVDLGYAVVEVRASDLKFI